MQCPVDQTVLQMSERQGVEIDYCPTCRGVWLDRGELDKIIDRVDSVSVSEPPSPSQGFPAQPYPSYDDRGHDDRGYDDRDRENRGYQNRDDDNRRYEDRRRDDRDHEHRGDDRRYDDRRGDPRYRKKKKEGFLGELFDF
jgi:hypothetical protein